MSDSECTCPSGRSLTEGHMDDCPENYDSGNVLVFRNPVGKPVAVPESVVVEAERPYRAFTLKQGGYNWHQIAAELDYLDAGAARYDVQRYLSEGAALIKSQQRQEMMVEEVGRLDALQAAIWGQAMKGHLPAVNACRDLIMSRAKLLKLDEIAPDEATGPRTVIVPMDPEGYAEALRRLSEPEENTGG